ncbi:hypothetical protein ATY81_02670 [Rhizobium sp. R72]|nr:hypothetical protein ATY81_02670 [Rhizobium sp. R72]OWW05946.1 hypothetical protein ATY80_02670 [Rhizobium sp. R711]
MDGEILMTACKATIVAWRPEETMASANLDLASRLTAADLALLGAPGPPSDARPCALRLQRLRARHWMVQDISEGSIGYQDIAQFRSNGTESVPILGDIGDSQDLVKRP